jgi:hypothetical protein
MYTVVVPFIHEPLYAFTVRIELRISAILVMKPHESILTELHGSQSGNRSATVARVPACLLCVNQQTIHDSTHYGTQDTDRVGRISGQVGNVGAAPIPKRAGVVAPDLAVTTG